MKLGHIIDQNSAIYPNLYTEREKNHEAGKIFHFTSYSTSRATVVEHALSGCRLALFVYQ